jgi:predicted outer membrane repeat protein
MVLAAPCPLAVFNRARVAVDANRARYGGGAFAAKRVPVPAPPLEYRGVK